MAKFTFGAGNAQKLLRLPLYALGALASTIVRRDDRLWVFGSGIGLGEGALPLYRAAQQQLGSEVRAVWLASDDDELRAARAAGLRAERKGGWRGFRLTLRARVLVITHGFGDVNRYGVRGGTVVQLWHGIPLKRLHLDSPATMRVSFLPDHRLVRALLRRAYRSAGRGISLFPVASAWVAPRIESAFGIPAERIAVTGDVRDDVLLRGAHEERRADARARIVDAVGPIDATARVVLYAPTWRDGAPDPGVPSAEEWERVAAWLRSRDAVLLVRSHPLGRGSYDPPTEQADRIRSLGTDVLRDVTPALPAVDALITDYSSIAYDFALTGGAIVFFAPDVERYAKSRGLYEPYGDFSGGDHVTTWSAVLDRLDAPDGGRRHAARLARENFDFVDGRAAERVLAAIRRHLRGERDPSDDADDGSLEPDRPADRRRRPTVQDLRFVLDASDGPVLRVTLSDVAADARVRLLGARATVEGVDAGDGLSGARTLDFPLLAERWGHDGLALPSGAYRLTIGGAGERDGESSRIDVGDRAEARHPLFRADAGERGGDLVLTVGPPLGDEEAGAAAQAHLEREYRAAPDEPELAVFFESFYGRSASCNPLGIDRALARLRPDVTRYWSVADASVPVPDGAVRVVEGTREWWRARRTARLLVVNDWLRKRWKPREYQTVLQTWHGTMLKRLALDRGSRGIRTRLAVLRERDRWDVLLAQNAYSEAIFRSAYAFRGPIWLEGYPRNDVLHGADAAGVRARLGIAADARVVLYAPTWRDDRTEMVDYLDLERFAAELDEGTVLLVRGHSRTLPFGRDLDGTALIDVTTYPSMADLLAAADVLVTDYSSVMFDWATTDRPIVFYTPDLAHYSADLRGFYFDLLAEAPGPVVSTREALLGVLRDVDAADAPYAQHRRRWRERFAPLDDGDAGERVVRRILAEGMLD